MLKMEYLIEQNKRAKVANNIKMCHDEWYKNEATRAVNQAIGRVIRHKNVNRFYLLYKIKNC